jgi:threonyl-tRNA synthetase
MDIDGEPFRLKPMNCPGHIMIYKTGKRSYRELPVRYCELGTVYRYERSGVLHGMLRVRGFTQDDAHIFCTSEQLLGEVLGVLDLADFMMKTFRYQYNCYLATRPEKFLGTEQAWDNATEALKNAMKERGLQHTEDPGGGLFYGPKIDVKILDALGREWQGPTIQVDFNLPERFDVTYAGADGADHRVVMIHRTVLGSMERFVGGLIEHYGGNFPLWLSPLQVKILPVTDAQADNARKVEGRLISENIRAEADLRKEKLSAKIRDAEIAKVPYMAIIGEREARSENLSIRKKKEGDIGVMSITAFVERLKDEISKRL